MGSNTAEHRIAGLGSIQIVHISGERTGDIEHFLPGTLSFGRHPNCDIVFPRDALTVSRLHARLECDTRQCCLVGLGGNGTYVNGELVDIAELKTGDVVTFSEHGPKLSFIFQTDKTANNRANNEAFTHIGDTNVDILSNIKDITPLPGMAGDFVAQHGVDALNQPPQPEFTLHYGSELRSFTKKQITVGRGNNADFIIDHPRLLEQHALLYFSGSHCFIANSTALKLIWLNGDLLRSDTRLKENDIISLNSAGPTLIYKGEGQFQQHTQMSDTFGLPPTLNKSGANSPRVRSLVRQLLEYLTSRLR